MERTDPQAPSLPRLKAGIAATGKGECSVCRRTSARAGSSQTFGREGTSPSAITGADRVGTGTPTRRGRASRSQTRSGAARIRSPRRRAASCGETDCQWYEAVARDKAANELHPIKTPPPRYPVAAEQSGQDRSEEQTSALQSLMRIS